MSRPEPTVSPRGSWLIGPVLLLSIAAAMRLVFAGPDELFLVFFAVLLTLGVLWILVSSLFPASAERTCPNCQRKGLQRIDPETTHGLRCRFCAWSDEDVSAFLHAEEEGPLEDIVLRERRRGPRF